MSPELRWLGQEQPEMQVMQDAWRLRVQGQLRLGPDTQGLPALEPQALAWKDPSGPGQLVWKQPFLGTWQGRGSWQGFPSPHEGRGGEHQGDPEWQWSDSHSPPGPSTVGVTFSWEFYHFISFIICRSAGWADALPLAGGQVQRDHVRRPKPCFPVDARETDRTRHRII